MFVFGGSTGSAMDDFHEFDLVANQWSPVMSSGLFPGYRFCHIANIYKDSILVFGGYDGSSRLNDFLQFKFSPHKFGCEVPQSTLVGDLREFVNSELLSDITFLVEGRPVYAHKVLCMRCTYFRALLTGEMMESRANEIPLPDVTYDVFLSLLEYLYTDEVMVDLENAMELFQVIVIYYRERIVSCFC